MKRLRIACFCHQLVLMLHFSQCQVLAFRETFIKDPFLRTCHEKPKGQCSICVGLAERQSWGHKIKPITCPNPKRWHWLAGRLKDSKGRSSCSVPAHVQSINLELSTYVCLLDKEMRHQLTWHLLQNAKGSISIQTVYFDVCGVTRRDKIRNETLRERTGIE